MGHKVLKQCDRSVKIASRQPKSHHGSLCMSQCTMALSRNRVTLHKIVQQFASAETIHSAKNTDSRSMSQIGMSCIGISIGQLLSHTENLAQEITSFQFEEKLRALIIVSAYFNDEKNFKREVLVSTESVKLLESLLFFFDFNASRLPLKILHFPGLNNEMKAYEIDKVTSRKIVENLIEEFVGIPKS
ncbi:hypothetical protein MTR_4g035220 [Medicago truncatula]|uniref:Uncharacterized protein n=1 Tax=Medicago truncatula TaxID=3880 RepID=G7JRB6_MEDTR|nr:hypothetical protein MTR_4g035220 [Medicago truncatula]